MLTVIEGRVLGCLMEKERTVPDQYPLSMNALVLACNQSSSRDPIMHLDEFEVDASITSMKTQGLVRIVHPSHGRSVTRYRQVADEKFELGRAAAAIIAVLLVRGPQTVAELRSRTERLHTFESADEVDACLHALAESSLVQLLDRQVGQKEQRWQQLIAEEAEQVAAPAAIVPASVAGQPRGPSRPTRGAGRQARIGSRRPALTAMYTPAAFVEDRPDMIAAFLVGSPDGPARDDDRRRSGRHAVADAVRADVSDGLGSLVGHVARANRQWSRPCPEVEALAIFTGPNAYVSPNWYPSKVEHGKVVPTWNYETVHIRGHFVVHDEHRVEAFARDSIDGAARVAIRRCRGRSPMRPPDYIETMLKAIVGIELQITSIQAKRKLSQNRPEADIAGSIAGLTQAGGRVRPRRRRHAVAPDAV